MSSFDLQISWPEVVAGSASSADATFAKLRVFVDGENATRYVEQETGADHDHVEQPMAHLAEWVVDNWWSLLWEPEKTEDPDGRDIGGRDVEFLARHSFMNAEHGFALPDVRLVPTGANVQIFSKPRNAEYAGARFVRHGKTLCDRSIVENELRGFVTQVVNRLPEGVGNDLRESWALVRETDADAEDFCRLMGAMGLSPYEGHPRIEAALDAVSDKLSREELFDLCQTATVDDFVRSAQVAGLVSGFLNDASSSDVNLAALSGIYAPGDNLSAPAYRRGQFAARQLRSSLGIPNRDLSGAARFFERLEIDYRAGKAINLNRTASPVSGAVACKPDRGQIAIVHQTDTSRRFAAARGAYFLWTGAPGERRLLTNAVTRSQQASRAFAAEMLVPQEIVRAQARGLKISRDQITIIAEEAMVSPDVVRHQATNAGLRVVS